MIGKFDLKNIELIEKNNQERCFRLILGRKLGQKFKGPAWLQEAPVKKY